MFENPDVPARFGAFPVDRLQPLFLESATGHFGTALVIAAVPAAILFLNRRSVPEASERLKANLGLVTMCLLSLFALPLSTILLGQTIQPYHFADEAVTFKTISIVVATAQGFDLATAWLHRRYPAIGRYPALRRAMLVAVAALCLSIGVKLHQPVIADQLHERRDFAAYQVRGYRQAFRALTNELGHDRYAAAQVLGTLDVQVLDWWSLFGGMHAFAPEPCSTNIGDDEVEDRLLRLFRELGASRRRVARLVNDRAVLIFFLGCAKYQVSPGHSFAPISDYSPAVQQRFARSSPLWSWSIALPTRETRRLVERYDRTPEGQGDLQLDLLVLGPGRLDRGLAPSPERFQLTYQNALFRVYLNVEANLPGEKS
jgi:hypothetical protein